MGLRVVVRGNLNDPNHVELDEPVCDRRCAASDGPVKPSARG